MYFKISTSFFQDFFSFSCFHTYKNSWRFSFKRFNQLHSSKENPEYVFPISNRSNTFTKFAGQNCWRQEYPKNAWCLEGSSRTWVCVCVCDIVLGAEYSGLWVGCQPLMKWGIWAVGQYGGFICGVCDLHHKIKLAWVEILALPLTYKLLELTEPSPSNCLLSIFLLNET